MHILYGSINPYKYEHGRAKHIYRRLAEKQDVDITWIDPPESVIRRGKQYGWSFFQNLLKPVRVSGDNFDVYTPVGLPFYLSSRFAWLITEKAVMKFIDKLSLKPDLVIAASPVFLSVAKRYYKQGVRLIYDCRDYFVKWEHVGNYASIKEQELISLSDLVVVPSFALGDALASRYRNMNITVIPNGVPRSMIGGCDRKLKKDRAQIGYLGFLANYLNFQLLIEIAKDKPEWDFVFIGDFSRIKRLISKVPTNFKFPGEMSGENLEKAICKLDVCTIPFIQSELTNVVFPIKLLEYFGKGKPVVSLPLKELRQVCKDLVYFADTKDEWISCLEAALSDKREKEFIDFAKKYTWEEHAERYYSEITRVMEKREE